MGGPKLIHFRGPPQKECRSQHLAQRAPELLPLAPGTFLREPRGLSPPAPLLAWEEPRRPQPHSTAAPGRASGTEARDSAACAAPAPGLHVPSSEGSKGQNLLAPAETPPSCPPLLPSLLRRKENPTTPRARNQTWVVQGTGKGHGAWAVPEPWPSHRGLAPLPHVRPAHRPPSSLRTMQLPRRPRVPHPPPPGVPCPHARGCPPAALQEPATDQTPRRPRSPGQRHGNNALRGRVL